MCFFVGAWVVGLAVLGSVLVAGLSCLPSVPGLSCALPALGFRVRDAMVSAGILTLGLGLGVAVPIDWRTRPSEDRVPARIRGPTLSADAHPRRRTALSAGIAVGVAGGIVASLVLLPIPQSFSMHDTAIYDPNVICAGIDTSQGTTVHFHWTAASPTVFFVVSCSAHDVAYEGNGTGGSASFVSVGGVYQFGASCPEGPCVTADVTGTFTAPVLPL